MRYFVFLMSALLLIFLTGCATQEPMGGPTPARFSIERGSRIAIVPEDGNDSQELCHKLYELFAQAGYYELVDRAELSRTLEERRFQSMSFVEARPSDNIRGVDAFIYLRAEAAAGPSGPSDFLESIFSPYNSKILAKYVAVYRMILTGNSRIAAARQIDLTDTKGSFSLSGDAPPVEDAEPMVQRLRDEAAWQIFESLHP